MANKNTNGTLFNRFKDKEARLAAALDRRTNNGDDRENVDPVWQEHSYTQTGERVWSF